MVVAIVNNVNIKFFSDCFRIHFNHTIIFQIIQVGIAFEFKISIANGRTQAAHNGACDGIKGEGYSGLFHKKFILRFCLRLLKG